MKWARVVGPWAFALATILLLTFGLQFAAALPFAATLAPSQAIEVDGLVTTTVVAGEGLIAAWEPNAIPRTVDLRGASVTVLDVTWKSPTRQPTEVASRPNGKTPSVAYSFTSHATLLDNPSLAGIEAATDARWVVTTQGGNPMRLTLSDGVQCLVGSANATSVRLTDDPRVPYASDLWTPPTGPMTATRCDAPEVRVSGAARLTVYGTTATLVGTSKANARLERVTVKTGLTSTPDPNDASLVDWRLTALQVVSAPSSSWILPGGDVFLQTRTVNLEGKVHVPPGEGNVDWAGDSFLHPTGTVSPEGTFIVQGSPDHRLVIHGDATNRFVQVAIGIGATALAFETLRRGAVFLFTRLAPERALDNPRRRMIHDAVAANPGLHVEALARLLGINGQSTHYHVGVLRRHGLLRTRGFGRRTALYPATTTEGEERRLFALRKTKAQAVLDLVTRRPALTQTELAGESRMSQSSLSRILAELVDAGMVTAEKAGRRLRYSAALIGAKST